MNITEQAFSCKKNDLTIKGMMYLPEDSGEGNRYPVLIASHGFLDDYRGMTNWCRDFADIGYAAFCFSFCGGGNLYTDDAVKSDGLTTDMTVFTEVADLMAVIAYVKQLPFVDPDNLTLLGASQGGFVSGLTAAKCGDAVTNLIMLFPALCIPDHARRGCLGGSSYDPTQVPEILDCGRTLLGRQFHEEVVEMDPYLEIAAYKGPVLIIQGMEDPTVNYTYAVRAKECYQPGQCKLILVPDMGHGYTEEQRNSAFLSMRQFLDDKSSFHSSI